MHDQPFRISRLPLKWERSSSTWPLDPTTRLIKPTKVRRLGHVDYQIYLPVVLNPQITILIYFVVALDLVHTVGFRPMSPFSRATSSAKSHSLHWDLCDGLCVPEAKDLTNQLSSS